jgi:hypothetical protein
MKMTTLPTEALATRPIRRMMPTHILLQSTYLVSIRPITASAHSAGIPVLLNPENKHTFKKADGPQHSIDALDSLQDGECRISKNRRA